MGIQAAVARAPRRRSCARPTLVVCITLIAACSANGRDASPLISGVAPTTTSEEPAPADVVPSAVLELSVPILERFLASDYQNLSFAAFALHRWYARFASEAAADFRVAMAPRMVAHSGEVCSSARGEDGFFDACANLLLALSDMDANDDAVVDDALLRDLYRQVLLQPPLSAPQINTAHAAGLNFSRSWSIYAAAVALDDSAAVRVGDQYFLTHLRAPELWRDDYRSYAHWVAQFGVHALDLRSQAEMQLLRGQRRP